MHISPREDNTFMRFYKVYFIYFRRPRALSYKPGVALDMKVRHICLHIGFFDYLCSAKPQGHDPKVMRCGEIWLLATTIKNAKMLTVGSSAMVTARISMFRILAAPHPWGFFVLSTCHSFAAKVLQVPAFPRAPVTVLREKRNRWHHSPAQPQTKHHTRTTLR